MLVAINLNAFESYGESYLLSGSIVPSTSALSYMNSINYTPSVTGNHVVLTEWTNDIAAGDVLWDSDTQINGTTDPEGYGWTQQNVRGMESIGSADILPHMTVGLQSLSKTNTYNISLRGNTTSSSAVLNESQIIVFSTTLKIPPAPNISYASPTPDNASLITVNWTEINVSITDPNLDTFIWNWNGTNYSLYDDSLVGMWNFNNVSATPYPFTTRGFSIPF